MAHRLAKTRMRSRCPGIGVDSCRHRHVASPRSACSAGRPSVTLPLAGERCDAGGNARRALALWEPPASRVGALLENNRMPGTEREVWAASGSPPQESSGGRRARRGVRGQPGLVSVRSIRVALCGDSNQARPRFPNHADGGHHARARSPSSGIARQGPRRIVDSRRAPRVTA